MKTLLALIITLAVIGCTSEYDKNYNKDPYGWHCPKTGRRIGFCQKALDEQYTVYTSYWYYCDDDTVCPYKTDFSEIPSEILAMPMENLNERMKK